MCPTPSHSDLLDWSLALQAGFAFAAVGPVAKLKETFFSIGVHIIGDRRSTGGNGLMQNPLQSRAKLFQFSLGKRVRAAARPDTGTDQALIGVDVPNAVKQLLIKQCSF